MEITIVINENIFSVIFSIKYFLIFVKKSLARLLFYSYNNLYRLIVVGICFLKLYNWRDMRVVWSFRQITFVTLSVRTLSDDTVSASLFEGYTVTFKLWSSYSLIRNNVQGSCQEALMLFNLRVWSWLRTNAGGRPHTCKSSGPSGQRRTG